jgi:Kdo2-lipid IVA lauroyltransferase/acyltransferase
MDTLIYWFARALVAAIQALPLTLVAHVGRVCGALAYRLDARHRRVALQNLTLCFGHEKAPDEIRALARENFRRIGENYACAIKTAAMNFEALRPHVEFVGIERLPQKNAGQPPPNVVVAIGHFGNFELYARFGQFCPDYQCATTYRALKHPAFDRLLQQLRGCSGCLFFERRTGGPLLRTTMHRRGIILGFLTDQSTAGFRGPFLGHDCSTTLAPAVFALRYHCELYTGVCYRVAPAKWRLELGEKILTHENGKPRPSEQIMRDANRALENAVHRDPANWFWVHRRWKAAEFKVPGSRFKAENEAA